MEENLMMMSFLRA